MKIKTAELAGKVLDFAVALIEGATYSRDFDEPVIEWTEKFDTPLRNYNPSTNWSIAGPIIQRDRICLQIGHDGVWLACIRQNYEDRAECLQAGQNPLEAAMRCLVKANLGDEVGIPEELL